MAISVSTQIYKYILFAILNIKIRRLAYTAYSVPETGIRYFAGTLSLAFASKKKGTVLRKKLRDVRIRKNKKNWNK